MQGEVSRGAKTVASETTVASGRTATSETTATSEGENEDFGTWIPGIGTWREGNLGLVEIETIAGDGGPIMTEMLGEEPLQSESGNEDAMWTIERSEDIIRRNIEAILLTIGLAVGIHSTAGILILLWIIDRVHPLIHDHGMGVMV